MNESTSKSFNDLQFDQAEYENNQDAQPVCAVCNGNITSTYFDAGGKTVCPNCRERVEAELIGGSGIARFMKAVIFGVPAAALGAGIYYGISALTGYEFGLVAIIIGLLVGAAVRAGASRRGGWLYQALAMLLTYIAIVSTYIPSIIQGFKDAELPSEASISQPLEEDSEPGSQPQPKITPLEKTDEVPIPSIEMSFIAIGLLLIIAMAAPFLTGFENIIGLIIIAIGLYEAWKLNKRNPIVFSGPYELGADRTGAGGTHA